MVGDGLYVMWSFITLGTLWIYYWHADEISVKVSVTQIQNYEIPHDVPIIKILEKYGKFSTLLFSE